MDVHHDGAAVLTGGEDADAFLSQPGTGKVVGKLVGHEHAVEAVGFCPLAPIMATADASGECEMTEGTHRVSVRGLRGRIG